MVLLASVQALFDYQQGMRAHKFSNEITSAEASSMAWSGPEERRPNFESIMAAFSHVRFYWDEFKATLSEDYAFPITLYGLATGWWLLEWRTSRNESISN